MNKAVIIYSGGMDSFTLLHETLDSHDEVIAISFNYGQRHKKELLVADAVCRSLNVRHHTLALDGFEPIFAGSALTDDIAVPDGHYQEHSMQTTVVPNRNMIMLSIAIGLAVTEQANSVYFGAHAGDHAIYPDCRKPFLQAMNTVAAVANYQAVAVKAPYIDLNKGEILARGLARRLDYSTTWTCYRGEEYACGRCGSCQERLEAFAQNGSTDPLPYE